MIIVKTPLRISFVGGGSDIDYFYKNEPGAVVSTAIDKYIYITVNKKFDSKIRASYSKTEIVDRVDDLKHELIRESLKLTEIDGGIEITSIADVHSRGTGLGSSSTYTVGLLRSLHTYKEENISAEDLAREACRIEIEKCKKPIGKQDQYIASYGGLRYIQFNPDESVVVRPIDCSPRTKKELELRLLMLYTGLGRSSETVLADQKNQFLTNRKKREILRKMVGLAQQMEKFLNKDQLDSFGELLDENWNLKKKLSGKITNPQIEEWYKKAKKAGAIGGKICFLGKTIIKTENGYKQISEVVDGEKVYDYRNNLQVVNKVMKRKYNGNMVSLKVRGLQNDIIVTPEHPFFVTKKHPSNKRIASSRKIVNIGFFKKASELKKGSCLLIPIDNRIVDKKYIKVDRNIEQSKYSKYDIYSGIPRKLEIGYDFLNMLGWYIAEGCSNNKQFHFTLNINELKYADEIRTNIYNLFNKKVSIYRKSNINSCVVCGSSKVISHLLNSWCGKGAENKRMPSFIMKLPIVKQSILLRSLWLGDGHIKDFYDKRTGKTYLRVGYKTISFELAKQVQQLCHRLGFVCGLKKSTPKNRKIKKDVYSIDICGDDAKSFSRFLKTGNLGMVKRSNSKGLSLRKNIVDIDGIKYVKASILSKDDYYYDGLVFNLDVDKTSTYIAEDVAVHNCGAGGGGFLLLYAPTSKHQKIIESLPLMPIEFSFDPRGSRVIYGE